MRRKLFSVTLLVALFVPARASERADVATQISLLQQLAATSSAVA